MDPKKLRIYIIIIIICLIVSIGVVLWGRGPKPAPVAVDKPAGDAAAKPSARVSADGTFQAPDVFPQNIKLDSSILDSSAFKSLKIYTQPTIDKTELGRENPFKTY